MNIDDQKEFIRGLFSYKKNIKSEESRFIVENFESEFSESISKELFGSSIDPNYQFDIEQLFSIAEENGVEPIEYVEFIFNMFQNMQEFEHHGKKINFSHAMEIFERAKQNFIEQKEAQDIKNF